MYGVLIVLHLLICIALIAHGDRMQIFIQHIELCIGNRPPNRNGPGRWIVVGNFVYATSNHSFGWAILVNQSGCRRMSPPEGKILEM